jgi:LCP family protein required for cell wall assembly
MKKWLFLILVLIIGGGYLFQDELKGYAFDIFLKSKVQKTLESSFEPIDTPDKNGSKPSPAESRNLNNGFNVLLLGVDARPGSTKGRSDAIMIATVKPKQHEVQLVSIPRDTYVSISGHGKDKINHAYAFGGAALSVPTVEKFLDIDIDYYASINFEGFEDLIDELGGVSLPITKRIVNDGSDHEKFTIEPNKSKYSGLEALRFARYREDSDVERTKRHQVVIQAMMSEMKKVKNITKINNYFTILGKNFKTNVPSDFATDVARTFVSNSISTNSYSLEITSKKMDGIYYDFVDDAEIAKAHDMIISKLNEK